MTRLAGRVAAVTGGALGIGRATALRFAEEGASVVLGDVQVDAVEGVAKEIAQRGGRAVAVGVDVGDAGQVQAYVGSLFSPLVSINVHSPSDTLAIVGPDTMTVSDADTASAALDAAVQTLNPPGGVLGTSISYVVFDSLSNLGLVHFQGGGLSLRAETGVDGSPITDVTLRRAAGVVQPDSVIVEVFAFRPSQAVVPGSGQRFIVRFQ